MPLVSWRRSAVVTATSWTTWRRRCSSASQNTYGRSCWRRRCSSRLSGELCDAVTGSTGSQALLEAIERANLFLMPLDPVRGWWRYHHLFADLLHARLRQEQSGKLPRLHRAAAGWYEAHGLADEAIRHALAAGDAAWAAELIERHFDALLERAEGATVDRWVAALPAELVSARPRLRLAQAVWALMAGRVGEAERLLAHAECALETGGDEPGKPPEGRVSRVANVPASIALVRADIARRRGDAVQMDVFTQQARAHLTEDDQALRPHVGWYLAVAGWLRGQVAEAEDSLVRITTEQQAAGERYLAVRPACDLGQVRQARGHLDGALHAYNQALEIATEAGRPLPPAGMAHLGMAEVLYQRDDLDAAARHATEGVALCRQLAYTQPLATGLAALAWIRQAQGDREGALETMAEAERVAPGPGLAGVLNPVPAQRARLLLAQGDVAEAARWADERGLSADDEPSYPSEPEHLVLARLLLAQDRTGEALALLERWLAAAAAAGRTGSMLQLRTLLALALAASGDQARALSVLVAALSLACPHGYVRVFADEGAAMGALLGQLAAARQRPGRSQRCSGGLPDSGPGGVRAQARDAGRRSARWRGFAPARRAADRPRAGGAAATRRWQVESEHRPRARGRPQHRQKARQPRSGEARRG